MKYYNAKARLFAKIGIVAIHLLVGGGLAIYSAWEQLPVITALFFSTAMITFVLHHLASIDPGFLDQNESESNGLLVPSENEQALARYCQICNIEQPIRTKHCKSCNKCIDRYDHHCSLIGICVGSKNHRAFWFYLFVQTICVVFVQMMNFVNYANPPATSTSSWFIYNLPFLYISFVLFGIFLLPSLMLFYHTFLMFTNMTTWEQTRRKSITYLKNLPRDCNPFDLGWRRNAHQFFFAIPYQRINWRVEANDQAKEQ